MKSLTQEQQKMPLWKFFFIFSGFMTLIHWNSVLNLILYFDQVIQPEYFVYLTFAFSVGNISSFLTLNIFFSKVSTKKLLAVTMSFATLAFVLLGTLLEVLEDLLLKKIFSIILVLIIGYSIGTYQGKLSGFTSTCGPISISYMNIGIGISGCFSNVASLIFIFIFPITDLPEIVMRHQLICYLVFLSLVLLVFMYSLYKYNRKYGHFLDDNDKEQIDQPINLPFLDDFSTLKNKKFLPDQHLSTDMRGKTLGSWKTFNSEPKYSAFSVFKRILDQWAAILFTFYLTLQIVSFFIPELTKKYDDNNNILMAIYFFSFNFGDTLGKMIPPKYKLKNIFNLHFATLIRILIQGYFVWIIFYDVPLFFSHYMFRITVYLLIGISNGYLTNNFFFHSSERFRNLKNRDKAGFFIVFGLVTGVTLGSFSGILWTI